MVIADPRARGLRTISVAGDVAWGIGALSISRGYGFVFENREGKWFRGDDKTIHDSLVAGGASPVGSVAR